MKKNLKNTGALRHCPILIFLFFSLPYFTLGSTGHSYHGPPLVDQQQEYILTGTVTDGYGPLPGVHILIKGTDRGTFTDRDGTFAITVAGSNTLVFSYVGYHTLELPILGRTEIDVELRPEATQLQEVEVNAGYYTVKERERTGSISRVTAEEIGMQPVSNPLAALQGHVTGLQIIQQTGVPGGGFDIRIRGRNSITSGNDPLYIINGVPYTSTSLYTAQLGGPFTSISPLNFINPKDIESIEVLKDADATAIYGSRGANGVILITTKAGKSGKTSFDINTYSGIGKASSKMDLLNREQYLEIRNEAFANDGTTPGPRDYDLNGTWDNSRETDWQKELIGGTAEVSNIDVNVSGGNTNTRFLLGTGYYKETTVFPGDFEFNKASVNFKVDHTSLNQKFTVSFSGTYLHSNNNISRGDLTSVAVTLPPVAPSLYDEAGNLNWEDSTWTNPLTYTVTKYEAQIDNLLGNAVLNYKIIPELEFKSNIGYTSLIYDDFVLFPSSRLDPASSSISRSSTFGTRTVKTWIIEPQLVYNNTIGEGKMSLLLGATFQQNKNKAEAIRASGFSSDALLENLSAAGTLQIGESNNSIYRYNALFGRINYSWNEKYIINLTARRDGSSRFGPGKRFSNFGAIGAAWIFSNESYLKNSTFLSFGKVRASYGTTGNDQIGDYQFLNTYSATLPYQGVSGLKPTRLFNPDFSWETTKKVEVGLEVGLLQDKIFVSGSFYRNRSSNQLLTFPLAPTTGFPGIQSNLPATVQNTGLEFELLSNNIKHNDISWTTSLNISFPRNKLIAYPDIENSPFATVYKVGESLNIQNKLKYLGVDPDTGIYTFEDVDGNGSGMNIPADLQFNKTIEQKYYGGLQNSIACNGLQLDFIFRFVNQTGQRFTSQGSPGTLFNQSVYVLDRWQDPGDITNIQQFTQSPVNPAYLPSIYGSLSDQNIIDASYIRLQNVSLSYTFDDKLIDKIFLQNLRVYFQAQNLLTFSNFQGLDPANARGLNVLPPLRVMTLGIQLTF